MVNRVEKIIGWQLLGHKVTVTVQLQIMLFAYHKPNYSLHRLGVYIASSHTLCVTVGDLLHTTKSCDLVFVLLQIPDNILKNCFDLDGNHCK